MARKTTNFCIKLQNKMLQSRDIENLHKYYLGVQPTEEIEKPKFGSCSTEKKRKIRAILYDCESADSMEAGFSLNDRHKRVEDTPG